MSSSNTLRIENPTKEGWLEKKSRHLGRWRRRWFVLHGCKLYSFKSAGQGGVYEAPTEAIDLRVFSSVKSSEDFTNRPHSFDVYSSEMRFSMVAESDSSKEDWIRAIGRAIVLSHSKDWQNDETYDL
ncbi:MAG: hypothetical protein MHM6MM_006808 [Cercozoa sp. M6MM]